MGKTLVIIADIIDNDDACCEYLITDKNNKEKIVSEINKLSEEWYDLEQEDSYDKYENQFRFIRQKLEERHKDIEYVSAVQVNI